MTNTKSTKRALLASVMAMLLCFTMLLGTTFAWFTDSVTSSGNKIVAGTLDVKLLMDADVDGTYDDISNRTSPIFGEGSIAQNNNAATLWEPGKTQVAYLAIQNGGNLDLKYTVGLNVQNVSKDLYEVMEYAIVADADKDAPVTSWTSGNSVVEGTQSVSGDVSLPVGATHYFALVIHMDEEAGNEYQDGEVNFDLTVLATQDTVESDSFNNQYDKDAVYGDVMVSSDAELKAAIEDPAMKVIAVNGDLTYDWGSESYENSKALNMKGKIFLGANDAASITFAGYGSANPIVDATFRNITIKDSTVGDNEASWEHGYLEFKNLTAVNVTFANSIMMEGDFATFKNCSFNSNKDGEYAVWVANGDATFEGCTFTGPRGVKVHEAYGSEVGTVVIDNNTFAGLTQKPGVAIGTVNADTTITIKNSDFINCQAGDQNLYIYETDNTVPTLENNTVLNNISEVVEIGTKADLFAFAQRVNGGDSMINKLVVLTADIDLENEIWTPVGQTRATEFKGVFDGQGHTIKNLNVDSSAQTGEHYSSGLFGWVEGKVTIKNVNIDGATVKGNHNVAVLLGYTYSAQISNCHVSNAKVINTHANDAACGDKAGTIAGYAGDESRFTNCSASNSTVTAGRDAGQLIGAGYNVSISGCSATAVTVTAGGDCTGNNINNAIIGRVMG